MAGDIMWLYNSDRPSKSACMDPIRALTSLSLDAGASPDNSVLHMRLDFSRHLLEISAKGPLLLLLLCLVSTRGPTLHTPLKTPCII